MSDSEKRVYENIRIVGLPKGAVLWPTAATGLILGLIGMITGESLSLFSSIFLLVFSLNLLILFFDFARGAVFGIFGLIVAGVIAVNAYDLSIPAGDVLKEGIFGGTSGEFLFAFGLIFLILLFVAYLFRRSFEYYVVSSNEIVMKNGILGDATRFNAPNVTINKNIDDVFESILLFGAGDLTIRTQQGEVFRILNVPRINKVEEEIRHILGKLEVDID